MKINIFNKKIAPIDRDLILNIQKVLALFMKDVLEKKECNIILQSYQQIAKLNKELFNIKGSTDVISVNNPLSSNKQTSTFLGDVYICPQVIKENAKAYNVPYEEELTRIIIHGILHLLGYDHKKSFRESRERMFKIQERLVDKVLNKLRN